jgi:hypothetical protein
MVALFGLMLGTLGLTIYLTRSHAGTAAVLPPASWTGPEEPKNEAGSSSAVDVLETTTPEAREMIASDLHAEDKGILPVPASVEALGDFLPYPTGDPASLERKYHGRNPSELKIALGSLRARIDEEARSLLASRIKNGQYEERIDVPTSPSFEVPKVGSAPEGLGRTWPCTESSSMGTSMMVRTVYLTEAEHPELFAHQDETLYVMHRIYDLEHPH